MTEPSQNDVHDQIKQAQQSAWPQASPQPQPLHPMAAGAPSSPPPLPTLPISTPGQLGGSKKKGITISMSKLSLLTIALSLMFLGALTFLVGFLVGVWFSGTSTLYAPQNMQMGPTFEGVPQQQAFYPNTSAPFIVNNPATSLPTQAGYATQAAVSSVSVPNVPNVLNPFVSVAQTAVGEQLGHKVQEGLTSKEGKFLPPSLLNHHTKQPDPSKAAIPSSSSSHISKNAISLSSKDKGEYTVQLGVYAASDNANALVNHLQSLNLISTVTEGKSGSGSQLYYVHSGRYNDYSMALKAASDFGAYSIPGAIVVKLPENNKSST